MFSRRDVWIGLYDPRGQNAWEWVDGTKMKYSSFSPRGMNPKRQIARAARLDNRQSTAIAIELGVHNTTLAMAVGAMVAPAMIIPAAVYGLFMFITAGVFARWMHHRNA